MSTILLKRVLIVFFDEWSIVWDRFFEKLVEVRRILGLIILRPSSLGDVQPTDAPYQAPPETESSYATALVLTASSVLDTLDPLSNVDQPQPPSDHDTDHDSPVFQDVAIPSLLDKLHSATSSAEEATDQNRTAFHSAKLQTLASVPSTAAIAPVTPAPHDVGIFHPTKFQTRSFGYDWWLVALIIVGVAVVHASVYGVLHIRRRTVRWWYKRRRQVKRLASKRVRAAGIGSAFVSPPVNNWEALLPAVDASPHVAPTSSKDQSNRAASVSTIQPQGIPMSVIESRGNMAELANQGIRPPRESTGTSTGRSNKPEDHGKYRWLKKRHSMADTDDGQNSSRS